MAEVATNGLSMEEFSVGDIPEKYRSLALRDPKSFAGTWEDIKDISEPIGSIMEMAGVSFLKRKALAISTLKVEIKVEEGKDGNPSVNITTHYPLKITKQTSFCADGVPFDQPDKDTCDWKTVAAFCNGRLVQKRVGTKGIMYDARCILSKHPEDKTTESPVMCFHWTMVDPAGNKQSALRWLKKIK